MQKFMLRLASLLRRRKRVFIGLWLATLLAALPLAAREESHLTGGGWEAGGSQSVAVKQSIERDFRLPSGSLFVVLVPHRDANRGDLANAIGGVNSRISTVRDVHVAPAATRLMLASARSQPDRPVVLPIPVSAGDMHAIDVAKDLRTKLGITPDKAGSAAAGRIDVHVEGLGGLWAAFQDVNKKEVQSAEARGFPIIAIVLLMAFGSAAAAALPLSLAFVTVIVTFALIYLLSLATSMSVFVTSMASMIGIGIAVDYSLFVLARYREEVRSGQGTDEALATALATSGVAVTFSGLTVIVSLAALFLVDSPGIRSMAAGPIIVVAISVLAASTLLPALIHTLGRRAYEPGRIARAVERRRSRRVREPGHGFWERWARTVMRRPVLAVIAPTVVLLALAYPALDLKVSNSATGQLDSHNEARQGYNAAAKVLGPGALGPALVVVDFAHGSATDRSNQLTLRRVGAAIERDPAVGRVETPRASANGRAAELTVDLRVNPESDVARHAIARLRSTLPTVIHGAQAKVGGTTATLDDFDKLVARSLWKIILFVLAFSFVVLVVLLRSIVLPIKAVLMNILSVTAAYGVLVAALQWGWLHPLGLEKTSTINTITPPLVLVVAFGLSMDYEVFLLSRIRERYLATGDNTRAVSEGLASSAGTITSAALIMVAVFLSFVSARLPNVQQIGLASAFVIAADATIVRLVLVPGAMKLLGKWNWWLPRPIARILPAVSLERVRVQRRFAATPTYANAGNGAGSVDEQAQEVAVGDTAQRR